MLPWVVGSTTRGLSAWQLAINSGAVSLSTIERRTLLRVIVSAVANYAIVGMVVAIAVVRVFLIVVAIDDSFLSL